MATAFIQKIVTLNLSATEDQFAAAVRPREEDAGGANDDEYGPRGTETPCSSLLRP